MKNKFILYFWILFCIAIFSSAYTIHGNEIYEGKSVTDVAYTIRGNEIYTGKSITNVA